MEYYSIQIIITITKYQVIKIEQGWALGQGIGQTVQDIGQTGKGKLGIEKAGRLGYFKNFYQLLFFLIKAENALTALTKVQTLPDIIALDLLQSAQ